jgi:alkanesulfonate monooxygenase SsuD/methylene tetrahydromethanopterin reductase-like flavin-dependent oxidoreductase (luciferase family)
VGGENVDPVEVEGFLLRHPAINQVQIIGVPDPRLSEVPCASIVPKPGEDVLQFLSYMSYMAGKTQRVKLGSMVVVGPWHDPVRVAEQAMLLDHLANGRLMLGIGRRLARVEYEGFRLDQNHGRQRFLEYAELILKGLEQRYIEGGETLQQPRRALRPYPRQSFRGRTYAAAVSPESMPIMAQLGVGLLIIPQKP